MKCIKIFTGLGLCLTLLYNTVAAQEKVSAYMPTPWTNKVDKKQPLHYYPRPTMVRDNWQNLNGYWSYSITGNTRTLPVEWNGKVLVPFPIESYLSGVQMRIDSSKKLWYKKTITINIRQLAGKKQLLHIDACDWQTEIFVNGRSVAVHEGGYTRMSTDITAYLKNGANDIVIAVWDPTDAGQQPRGKQVSRPQGIYYTSVTGIWQTVWLETVGSSYIKNYKTITDIDRGTVKFDINLAGKQDMEKLALTIYNGGKKIASVTGSAAQSLTAHIPKAILWSPENPFLYHFSLTVTRNGKVSDAVKGYFGMRKIEVKKDNKNIDRLFLNNQPVFMYGPLDQGFWPDGIYTAPTYEALLSDVVKMKQMGFNMVRKHVKVEPEVWYQFCDQAGLLVWQDMPSGYQEIVPVKDHDYSIKGDWLHRQYNDLERNDISAADFKNEWSAIVAQLYNHPSIVVWVPFNESWGQYNTNAVLKWAESIDPTRVVDGPSGWIDRGYGAIRDYHLYEKRLETDFLPEKGRALAIGEFGGLGYFVKGHSMNGNAWSYSNAASADSLFTNYAALVNRVKILKDKGFSAAVYTQLTDVETEINGILTYDRFIEKMDIKKLNQLQRQLYK